MAVQLTRPGQAASGWLDAAWRRRYGADAELRFEPFNDPAEAARARADLAHYNAQLRRYDMTTRLDDQLGGIDK